MSKTIVWVEDDYEIIQPVVYPLRQAGYEIINYRTPLDAIKEMEQLRRADLILLDIFVPPGGGDEDDDYGDYPGVVFLRQMRQEFGLDVPVLVFTAIRRKELRNDLLKSGAADVIYKPILPSKLKEAVERVLGGQ